MPHPLLSLRLTPGLLARLDAAAAASGIQRSELVRQAIGALVRDIETQQRALSAHDEEQARAVQEAISKLLHGKEPLPNFDAMVTRNIYPDEAENAIQAARRLRLDDVVVLIEMSREERDTGREGRSPRTPVDFDTLIWTINLALADPKAESRAAVIERLKGFTETEELGS